MKIDPVEGNAVYHCIARVVGGEFLLGSSEREHLRSMLAKQIGFAGLELLSFAILSNHFHVLVRVPKTEEVVDGDIVKRVAMLYSKRSPFRTFLNESMESNGKIPSHLREALLKRMGDISMFMKELKQRFSIWYNRIHERRGTLWMERFRSVLVQDEPSVLRTVSSYIDLNPVRAGIVEDPKDYRWCNYSEAVVGTAEPRRVIISYHHGKGWVNVQKEYRMYLYVRAGNSGASSKVALPHDVIGKVLKQGGALSGADQLRLKVRAFGAGVALGSRAYVEEVFSLFRDQFGLRRVTGARKVKDVPGELCALRDLNRPLTR
ncbi:hypothetical protein N9B94_03695 [Verrucomicrobia bacterium]|nr:hypothetical protein [Verrucomicrobiota bacterium]MDB4458950.1 hypothetical protein [bacterium]